jgi:hypothetical protein
MTFEAVAPRFGEGVRARPVPDGSCSTANSAGTPPPCS